MQFKGLWYENIGSTGELTGGTVDNMRSWINKLSKGPEMEMDQDPNATAAGVVALRKIWDIEKKAETRLGDDSTVSSDIYATSHSGRGIPQRRRGRRI